MKTILGGLLCCLPVLAAEWSDIRVVTTTNTHVSPGYVTVYEEFTRHGQTNLLRVSTSKDGATNSVAHNFYHDGVYLGRYTQSGGFTFINSAPGAPYTLSFVFDASNQVRIASVTTTNYVSLDSFTYSNGLFHPEASARIEESNRKTKDALRR